MGRRLAVLALLIGAGLGVYFAVAGGPEEEPLPIHEAKYTPQNTEPISDAELMGRELAASLAAAPGLGFPASLPWHPLHDLGGRQGVALELRRDDPLAFLEMCLSRHEREVRSYKLTFIKKERIAGKLYPPEKDKYEIIDVAFREKPFSVFFNWKAKGKLAARALYVDGANDNKLLARPFLTVMPVMTEDVNGTKAKNSGRYTIAEFGLYKATQRSVYHMQQAKARDELYVRYEGQVTLGEAGNRVCYKFVRTPYHPPEEEGVNELTLYIDCETWLQVGSVLRDTEGHLIAEYFFRDIVLNPEFDAKQFTRAAL